MKPDLRPIATVALAWALVGCAASASPATGLPTDAPGPSASGAVSETRCAPVDQQTPSGENLDLTGTWLGDSGTYWTFAQVGQCIWATALDHYLIPYSSRDYYWQWFIRGTLHSDFTISADFAVSQLVGNNVVAASPGYGHTTLVVDFEQVGGAESVSLRKVDVCQIDGSPPCPRGEISLQTLSWTLVSPTVILPQPTPGP